MERYYPHFDGIRAIAVFTVIVTHVWRWLPPGFPPIGTIAVQTFFALSGFLITGILLNMKDQADAGESLGFLMGRFYARRSLRILPLYYLAIVVAVLIPIHDGFLSQVPWFLLYGSNWYTFIKAEWTGYLSHFWTLAVEEQFYLLWPLAVLLMPRRALIPVFVTLMATSFVARLGLVATGWKPHQIQVATFCQLEALVGGALLALLIKEGRSIAAARLGIGAGLAALALLPVVMFCGMLKDENPTALAVYVALSTPMAACLGLFVIDRASRGIGGIVGRVLTLSPLVYMGRISYGIYVWHNIVLRLTERRFAGAWARLDEILPYLGSVTNLAVTTGLSVAVAAVTWHAFEAPINGLKRHFSYRRSGEARS